MKIARRPSIHVLLLSGALIVALMMRLVRLGVLPLTNGEAEIALQALAVARGTPIMFGAHMTTAAFAGLDFFIFTPGNFLARFWPALIGALIVFFAFSLQGSNRKVAGNPDVPYSGNFTGNGRSIQDPWFTHERSCTFVIGVRFDLQPKIDPGWYCLRAGFNERPWILVWRTGPGI